MIEVNLGRVVGSKIRNGNEMPTDYKGWLDGDIYILNNPEQLIPYYEYKPETEEKLILLGYLKGVDGVDGEKGDAGPQGPQGMPGGIVWIGDIEELPSSSSPSYNNNGPLDSYKTPGMYAFTTEDGTKAFIMLVSLWGTSSCLQKIYELGDDYAIFQGTPKITNFYIKLYYRFYSSSSYWFPLFEVNNTIRPIYTHYININGYDLEYIDGVKKSYNFSITLTLPTADSINTLEDLKNVLVSGGGGITACGYYYELLESGENPGTMYETNRLEGYSGSTGLVHLSIHYFNESGKANVSLGSRNETIEVRDVVK